MKRVIAALVASALMAVGTGAAFAAASTGVPEVDEANATISSQRRSSSRQAVPARTASPM